jgi:predicted amidophosphoribosyltransferase
MFDLSTLLIPPAGFGHCGQCAYLQTGTAEICFACASRQLDPLAEHRCRVCEQELNSDGSCPNKVCDFDDREFDAVFAISTLTGTLERAIWAYKGERQERGWAAIFGRVLVGFLDREELSGYDLIVPSPTYVGPGGRGWDHTGAVIDAAAVEAGDRYPFDSGDPRAILQRSPTRSFKELGWKERKAEAEGPLRRALEVPDSDRDGGMKVLVYHDVFTEGFRIREVARALRGAGAVVVDEVVLARQPRPLGWT